MVEGLGEQRLMVVVARLADDAPSELVVGLGEIKGGVRRLVCLCDDLVVSGMLHGSPVLRPTDV